MSNSEAIIQGVSILGSLNDQVRTILSEDATATLALLHRSFNAKRKELLQRRDIRQAELDKGVMQDFLPETKHVRENDAWKGAPPAPGLIDRRTEITGANVCASTEWLILSWLSSLCVCTYLSTGWLTLRWLFAEVFKIILGSIPNGADPMVEWFFLLSVA